MLDILALFRCPHCWSSGSGTMAELAKLVKNYVELEFLNPLHRIPVCLIGGQKYVTMDTPSYVGKTNSVATGVWSIFQA